MTLSSWQFWAVLSAAFAALTAIFAKVGVEAIDSDLAAFIRTLVIVAVLAAIRQRWANSRGRTPFPAGRDCS